MTLNLDSTYYVCQAVGAHMVERGRGSVINVSSVAGLGAVPFMSHYGAAKAAVLSLTRSIAVEWAHAGVRVNALVPGWVATDLTDFARSNEQLGEALISRPFSLQDLRCGFLLGQSNYRYATIKCRNRPSDLRRQMKPRKENRQGLESETQNENGF